MNYDWASATDVGRLRAKNEDAVWPRPAAGESAASGEGSAGLVVVVADGMGGHAGGEIASRVAIEAATGAEGDAVERVKAANLAVVDTSFDTPRLAGMGTTMTLAILTDEPAAEIGHIGDSRAYLFRDGRLTQLTKDHSLVAEMVAVGELKPEQAAVHPLRSVITRAIGLEHSIVVDKVHRKLRPGDRLLLCTDGLTSMVVEGDIAEVLGAASQPCEAAASLILAANRAGGADNISVVVVDVARDPKG
jgi:serine/threonine protein phosphatase PrpC